jgi:uncharacterized damage-inducible protein DinB
MQSAMPQTVRTISDCLPWVALTLDYTEQVAAAIPAKLLDWRPLDPSGRFCFSLAQIAMHIADARRMFAGQLAGATDEAEYWSSGPQDDGSWPFKPHGGLEPILVSLRGTRALLAPYLELPAEDILAETEGTRTSYARNLDYMRENGHDASRLERAGAPNIVRVLFALTVHEAGHRGALQTLLRQHGVNPGGEE